MTEQAAQAFNAALDLYDRVRPGYPRDALDYALPEPVGTVLDLGSGTGKLTAALVGRAGTVIAVDPSADSLERLRSKLPGVVTRVGTAEHTGLADSSVDAVVVGAAFHWFARPDADQEIARVLSPGGSVTLLWNPIDSVDPVQQVFADVRRSAGLTGDEFDDKIVLDRQWFGPTARAEFCEHRSVSVESLVDQLASRSYVLTMPANRRARVLEEVRRTLGTLAADGVLSVRYRTTALRAVTEI
ncbi:methyltransferase family protein [Amycolatopsis echigonensis]|uniref:Methyltransferase family protein n=1 Tax=Amycolatopsis echigonensis TaxID=2576905 RepID=A0A2N3X1T7_9PSEU|nr:class I SAM-dependent methyltransferase [Amycolatopsis niigatensis]PKW00083.1 methyltransferase family protein [Amycolatopsis niigatensis]